MDLLTYVRALRRRWLLIVACAVIGAVIGYGTTLLHTDTVAKKGRTYYKATNTVVVDLASGGDGGVPPAYSNLDQIALVLTTGDVPDRVATALQAPGTGRELAQSVVTTTNALTSTLDITAVDPDRQRAAKIADAFADALDASLQATAQSQYDTALSSLDSKIATLKQQSDTLLNELSAVPRPADFDTIQREYDATQNSYYSQFTRQSNMRLAGPASTAVTVLQKAEPEPINAGEYAARLDLGATGQNHLHADASSASDPSITAGTSSSSFNNPLGRAFAGGFLGLLVGIGIALFADRLDRRMRTREEVEHAFQLPVLAEVPRLSRKDQAEDQLVAFSAPLSRVAEAFRAVRTSLVFQQSMASEGSGWNGNGNGNANANGNGNVGNNGNGNASNNGNGNGNASSTGRGSGDPLVVMVTSAAPREGKSTTSANLAVAFGEGGASVLVVNCDFRRPTVHRRFGVPDEPLRVQDTLVPGVKIVTNVLSDPAANPSQVVAAQRQVIAAARGRFDVIILDTAPMLTANDAVGIVNAVDLVLLVAQLDMTTSDNAHRAMELLAGVHATVSGVVLIGASDASNEYYYYYQREQVAAETVDAEPQPDPTGAPEGTSRDLVGDESDASSTP